MILEPGGVVRDSLSGREDGCESYESVLRHHGPAFAIRGWRGAGAAGADYALFWPRKFSKTRIFYFPLNDSWTPSGCSRILPALRNASGATLPPLTLPPVLASSSSLHHHRGPAFTIRGRRGGALFSVAKKFKNSNFHFPKNDFEKNFRSQTHLSALCSWRLV